MRPAQALRRTLAVARAEWTHNYRDARSLGIIILLPLVLLVLYGYAINFDLRELRFAVQDWDRSEASADFVERMVRSEYFALAALVNDTTRIEEMVERGQVRFAVIIPPRFGEDLASGRVGRVQVLLDGSDSTSASVALGYLEGVTRSYSLELVQRWLKRRGLPAALAVPALQVYPRVLYNPEMTTVNFIVPGLIAVIMTMLAALLTSGCIVREREAGSFEGLASSPIAPVEIIIGKLLPYAGIAVFDVMLCIATGGLIFHIWPSGDRAALLVVSLVYLIASLSVGLAISSVARSHQVATLIAFLTTMLPTMLLTGFVFPVRSMPKVLQYISQVIPATHFLVVIRAIYLKGTGVGPYIREVTALALISLLFVVVAAKAFRKSLE